jgi:hypothetical protein
MSAGKKIVIIVVALIIVGGLGYTAFSFVKKKNSSDVVEKFTDDGFEVGTASNLKKVTYIKDPLSVDFGVSIYPGAKAHKDDQAQSATVTADGVTTKIGVFETADSVERVVTYYQKQIGSGSQTNQTVLGDTTYNVISKKDVLDPIVEVYKQGKSTILLIQKKI